MSRTKRTRANRILWATFLVLVTATCICIATAQEPKPSAEPPQSSAPSESEAAVLVGRIAHVEGRLLRYVPEDQDWVATVKDAPFGLDDALYSGKDGRAEFILPNNTWVRIGASTQIQMIKLEQDATELDIASGVARVHNKDRSTVVKAITTFGYVVAGAQTVFDLYVGEQSVEVVALKGQVDFVHSSGETKYEVIAGSGSILADAQQITSGEGTVNREWDSWNVRRDLVWEGRLKAGGKSSPYLPPSLHDEAYVLEQNGVWERVYYSGSYYHCWRPHRVYAGWAPYTVGRWTVWYGDHCWIPAEPFGYLTHHYGGWIYVGRYWYWAPPVVPLGIWPGPLLPIGFGWYPGRVCWIYSGLYIGWIALAPFEPYYCHYYWGPHITYFQNINLINIHIHHHRHHRHAVIVPRDRLYRGNNYREVKIAPIDSNSLLKRYRAAPVLSDKLMKGSPRLKDKFRFTDVTVKEKPHRSVLDRIRQNQVLAKETGQLRAEVIREDLARRKPGTPARDIRIEPPRSRDRIVPEREVNKPEREVQFPERELKGPPAGVEPGRERGKVPPPPGQPRQEIGVPKPLPPAPAPAKPKPPGTVKPPASPPSPAPRPVPPPKEPKGDERIVPGQPAPPSSKQPRIQPAPSSPREPAPGKPQGPSRPIEGPPQPPARESREKPSPAPEGERRQAPSAPSEPEMQPMPRDQYSPQISPPSQMEPGPQGHPGVRRQSGGRE